MAEESANEGKDQAIPPGRRAAILDNALRSLPSEATANERQRAIEAGRTAMRDNLGVSEPQLVEAVKLAVACVAEDVRRRLRQEHWRMHAPGLLPYDAEDKDKTEAVKLAVEELEHLPLDMSNWQMERQIRDALRPLCEKIEERRVAQQKQKQRERAKPVLVIFAVADAREYLRIELDPDDDFDDLWLEVEPAVRSALEEKLSGDEPQEKANRIAREVVDDWLD
ncbi:MAG TPA: hypothetical protein VHM88_11230 [Candidatus Acidoferrales bacterium]|nr:hypothetical protein [Candidatus Acidoferrales bacterium]